MKKTNIRSFVGGALTALVLTTVVVPAMAESMKKTIDVDMGTQIYVNDVKLTPTDVNGKVVDCIAYQGTTYLPVRALSNALGLAVDYDGKTNSVFIGKHAKDTPAGSLFNMTPLAQKLYEAPGRVERNDNIGNPHDTLFFHPNGSTGSVTYYLNGKYTRLTGTFFYSQTKIGQPGDRTLRLYDEYDRELWSGTVRDGSLPIPMDVDLTGVQQLRFDVFVPGLNQWTYLGEPTLFSE